MSIFCGYPCIEYQVFEIRQEKTGTKHRSGYSDRKTGSGTPIERSVRVLGKKERPRYSDQKTGLGIRTQRSARVLRPNVLFGIRTERLVRVPGPKNQWRLRPGTLIKYLKPGTQICLYRSLGPSTQTGFQDRLLQPVFRTFVDYCGINNAEQLFLEVGDHPTAF